MRGGLRALVYRPGSLGDTLISLPAIAEIREMHRKGRGVIGMKLIGEGQFTRPEDREKAIRYAMTCGFVDAIVIGFASPAEIDEAITRMNGALT